MFARLSRSQPTISRNARHFSLSGARRESSSGSNGPLIGITVVSLEQTIAAPFCTRQLADLGARVIKVERPGVGDFARSYDTRGKGLASHFVWTNRSKESLALDVKKPADHEALMRLLSKADVLVQNLAPGASARSGLSFNALKESHPRLIVCDISGYGQDGPYRDKEAYDLLVQSEAGMLSVTGTGKEPAKVGISIADIASAMYAYSNILAALLQRSKTGRGSHIDISMLECMAEWMGFPMYYAYDGAPGPVPAGASHASIYPYGLFETGDGQSVMLGIQNEREWANFSSRVLAQPNLATDARFSSNSLRDENRDELKISSANPSRVSRQKRLHADLTRPLRARKRWAEVQTPEGPVASLLPPGFTPSSDGSEKVRPRMDPIPNVGEHNESILAELGISTHGDE